MKKLLYLLVVIPFLSSANFAYKISSITPEIKQKMIKGNSYRAGCPVGLNSLRYLTLTYIGFDDKEHRGELIVNKSVAKDFVSVPISIWLIIARLSLCKYSMGSSIVIIWQGRVEFISFIKAANVVDFPLPVIPVIRTNPLE